MGVSVIQSLHETKGLYVMVALNEHVESASESVSEIKKNNKTTILAVLGFFFLFCCFFPQLFCYPLHLAVKGGWSWKCY